MYNYIYMVDRSVLAVANEFGLIVSMLLNLSTSKCKNIITFKTFSTNFLNKLHDLRLSAAQMNYIEVLALTGTVLSA